MLQRVPAILLAVHLLYVLFLPSLAAKVVSGIGCLITFALTLGSAVSVRFAARVKGEAGALSDSARAGLLAIFAFPLTSFIAQPSVAFVRVDAGALIIIAWLGALSWVVIHRGTDASRALPARGLRGRLPVLTQLFILWSALFWLMVIWDVGVGQAVMLVARDDRLTTSFVLWESRPASEHLFLIWTPESFARGIAYTNHPHPFLLIVYGCSKLVQFATGMPFFVGRNLTPFGMAGLGVFAFAALVSRTSATSRQGPKYHATLFVTLGLFLSQWQLWVYPFNWNFDTIFPVIAFLTAIVWATAHPRVSPGRAATVTASLVVFAAFAPTYTPVIVLAVWCLFGRPRGSLGATLTANRPLVLATIAAVVAGLAVYALPLVLVASKGYDNIASTFVYRSGLDGDTRYFRDFIQAVVQPYAPARTWRSLIFPALVPFVVAAVCARRTGGLTWRRLGRQSVFLVSPYLFSLALFPQAVSIHPYLYDVLLVLPIVLIGSTRMLTRCVQDRLRGASLLAAVLLAATLIMANLIWIAQGILPLVRR